MKVSSFLKIIILQFFFNSLMGQEKYAEDLSLVLNAAQSTKQRIDILNAYADTLCLHKDNSGYELAREALQLSKKENYHIGIGDASHSIGLIHFRRNNDSALYYFKQSHHEYLANYPGLEKHGFALNNISRTYVELLLFDSALYWARSAMALAVHAKENDQLKKKWMMYSCGAIANAQEGLGNYDSAGVYLLKAIQLAEEQSNDKMLEVYLKGIAEIQAQLKNYEKAIEYGKKAMNYVKDKRALTILLASMGGYYYKLNDFDNAGLMADSSLRLGEKINVNNSVGRNYITLGSIAMAEHKKKQALDFFKTGLAKALQLNNSRSSISALYLKIGEAYESQDSLQQARAAYLASLELARGDNEKVSSIYFLLSKLSFRQNNFEDAYKYLQQYQVHHDSVFTTEKIKAFQELNTKYETGKKDQLLVLLEKDKQLQRLELEQKLKQIERDEAIKQRQGLEITNYQLNEEKRTQQLELQELEIENGKIRQKEQADQLLYTNTKLDAEKKEQAFSKATIRSQQSLLFFSMLGLAAVLVVSLLLFNRYKLVKKIQGQQELLAQRQRISRDLHDELGATLSGISMYSHLVSEQLKSGNRDVIHNSLDVVQQSSSELVEKLNDIVWLTNPEKDSLDQLISRVEDYLYKMAEAKHIEVDAKLPSTLNSVILSADTRRHVYLFCKEAINNAVKYSHAGKVSFWVSMNADRLMIKLADNGKGFDEFAASRGNGLNNMRKRAEYMNGQMKLETSPGNGTVVELSLKITA